MGIGDIRNQGMHIYMDWRSVNFDWNRARAFLVTAEEGSLSAAARALGMTQPTLGRQVSAFEKELGIILFERAGHGLILTTSGLELLKHVRDMGHAASQLSLTANGQSQGVEGDVCISASEIYAAYILPPIIAKLRKLYPKIDIEIVASNLASDILRREADIALRNFEPTQPDLIAKKVKVVNARLYAAKHYLDEIGNPKTADQLAKADFIAFDKPHMLVEYLNKMGLPVTADRFTLTTKNYITHWELVKQGLGIGIMPEELGDKEPLVEQALPDFAPITFPIWLTTHRELRTSQRVRVVYDLLAEELSR